LRNGAALPVIAIFLGSASLAQMRQHSTHEHGRTVMNIAVEAHIVSVELIGPMANFAGFEHAPSSDQERQVVTDARAILEQPVRVFQFDSGAGCVAQSVQVDLPDVIDDAGDHEDEHHHDGDEHEDSHDDHLEIAASYTFECANSDRIQRISVAVFELFPSTEVIELSVLGSGGVTTAEMTPDSAELRLR
jgi:hypothetical protein